MDDYLFYCVYLLLNYDMKKSYIGSTPNPIRRLNQHNGILKGGAKKTIKNGPFEMILFVYGFNSQQAALQFEWAWQHPLQCSFFLSKDGFKKYNNNSINYKMFILSKLLQTEKFSRYSLKIHIINSEVLDVGQLFASNQVFTYGNPCKLATFDNSSKDEELLERQLNVIKNFKKIMQYKCNLCFKDIDIVDLKSFTTCLYENCNLLVHITCLAKEFLKNDDDHFIPISGNCIKCAKLLWWRDIVLGVKLRCRYFC